MANHGVKVIVIAACLTAGLQGVADVAHAQKLNLDSGPATLAPNSGKASLALAEQLEREGREIATGRAKEVVPEVVDVKSSVRLFAAALLRAGEGAGENGSIAVLTARTIAARLRAIDLSVRAIADEPGGAVRLAGAAADLASARAGITVTADALDRRVRDAFAQLAGAVDPDDTSVGWFSMGEAPAVESWPTLSSAFDPAAAKLWAQLGERLEGASRLAAYRDVAAEDRRMAVRAAGVIQNPPPWLLPGAAQVLRGELAAAAKEMVEASPSGRARLQRLAMIVELIEGVNRIEGNPARSCKAGVSALCVSFKDVSDVSERKRLQTLTRVLDAMGLRRAWDDEKRVLRQLRPALRSMSEVAKIAEGELAEALGEALTAPDAISSPKLINALAATKRRGEDLATLGRVSELLADPTRRADAEPAVRDDLKFLAERFLDLSKEALAAYRTNDVASRLRGDQKLIELRRVLGDTRDFLAFPAEADLRAAAGDAAATPDAMGRRAAWTTLLDDRASKLFKAMEDARKSWTRGWTKAKSPDDRAVAHARELRDVQRVLADAAEVELMIASRDGVGSMSAMLWPGWEVSRDDLTLLSADLPARARALADVAIESTGSGLEGAAGEALKKFRQDYAPVLLAGRLNAAIRRRGLGLTPGRARALSEVLASPTQGAWLVERRAELALVCRCMAESAWIKAKNDRGGHEFQDRGTALANDLLRTLADLE